MRKIVSLIPLCLICNVVMADVLPLDTALRNTYMACVGIDDNLADMKKMAGINTAITGVGTGLGIGATVTGIKKVSVDKEADKLEAELLDEIQKLEELAKTQTKIDRIPDLATMLRNAAKAGADNPNNATAINDQAAVIDKKKKQLDALNTKSKNLGNWRTGLLAGNTVTNVAGTIIAAKNRVDDDLQAQVADCIANVKNLQAAIGAARMNGEDVSEAQQIYAACREYEYVDLSPIDKRAKGAMITSAAGIGTGVAGTITSAVANTDKIRQDNTDAGKQKEKNLNTAANVLSAGSTLASTSATIFNAAQISAIKKVASVSAKCTGVLK